MTHVCVQVLSDLHLEFMTEFEQKFFFKSLKPEGVDILILAGDICSAPMITKTLDTFCKAYSRVVYVVGNHEFYGSSPPEVAGKLWDAEVQNKNLTWLDNRSVDILGVKLFGGTLWFPQPEDPKILRTGRWSINDFVHIKGFEPWVYGENAKCKAMLDVMAPKADIIVTHHLPTSSAISARFRVGPGSDLNHFFCDDLTTKIETWQPKLWVFGHTHDRTHFYIKNTLVLCNPKGYPNEKEFPDRGVFYRNLRLQVGPGPSGGVSFTTPQNPK